MPEIPAEQDVVRLCSDLIRLDSTNYGGGDGDERAGADYVTAALDEVGVASITVAPDGHTKRPSVIAHIPGDGHRAGAGQGALLLHGHLDVVPADASDWSVAPFSGEVHDGYVWGRGAVDMKNMNAMVLAVIRELLSSGRRPRRDLVLAFVADEEAGGVLGAQWLIDKHRDEFSACTDAIGEVGGFSYEIDANRRMYLVQTAEKGLAWLHVRLRGVPGHGSMLRDENVVTELAAALVRVGRHQFPRRLTPTTRDFLRRTADALQLPFDEEDVEPLLGKLGPLARLIGATLSNTANPTQLHAGMKVNVIPGEATATIDGRFLPGEEELFVAALSDLIGPGAELDWIVRNHAVETSFDGPLIDEISRALLAEDPQAIPVPYMVSAGTDAKSFSRLGMKCVGFAPLRLPAELDFASLFHGIDERVPVDGLAFGVRVLRRLLS